MKAIKTILLAAILLMAIGCSKASEVDGCDCEEIRYTIPVGQSVYLYHSTVDAPQLDCEDAHENIMYNGYYFVKVRCE